MLLSLNIANAQSWSNMFSKKNISKIASGMGVELPFDINGTWSYVGTAVELQTDDFLKKAAAQVAAIAVEEKINQQQAKYGIKPGMIQASFGANNVVTFEAMTYKIPAKYELSKDKKQMIISVGDIIKVDADIRHTLDNQLSLLVNADKVLELIKYLNAQIDHNTLKTISQVIDNYDGLKIGIQLEKKI
mgnify:FL=1